MGAPCWQFVQECWRYKCAQLAGALHGCALLQGKVVCCACMLLVCVAPNRTGAVRLNQWWRPGLGCCLHYYF